MPSHWGFISDKRDEITRLNSTYIDVLVILSFLIFIIAFAQIDLRSKISGNSLVFLDHVFFTMYFSIIYATLLSFLRCANKKWYLVKLLKKENYQIPKMCFLPIVLGMLFLRTTSLVFMH